MNKIFIPAVIALVISGFVGVAFLGYAKSNFNQSNLQGLSDRDVKAVSLKVGADNIATKLNLIKQGTCNLSQSSAGSHAASSSKEYFCAVSGVVSGDKVKVDLAAGAGAYSSGAQSLFGGFVVNSAYATTSNVIGVSIANLTGAATSSAAQATTSAEYFIYR